MTRGPGIWMLGICISALVHAGAGAGLMAALIPDPIVDQPSPESRLSIDAQAVARSQARAQTPPSEAATEAALRAASLSGGAISQSVATPRAPATTPVALRPPSGAASSARVPSPQALATLAAPTAPISPTALPAAQIAAETTRATATPASTPIVAATLPSQTVAAAPAALRVPDIPQAAVAAPDTERSTAKEPQLAVAAPARPKAEDAAALPPPAAATDTQPVPAPSASAVIPPIEAAAAAPPPTTISPPQPPGSDPVARQTPDSAPAVEQVPNITKGTAVLAFPGGDGPVDPVSLAAFQSFTQAAKAETTDLRDDLSAALSLPCARMQVTFDPQSATLQVNGHVPDPADRAPVLAALRAQMGSDIAVTENLLVLPAPQCAALSGIASVGLPQSTDQITNPLIVGADTHARAFRYTQGQPLVLSLTAPDYPAYIYVDYFDAAGNVIHLSPNDATPLRAVSAEEALQIGARSADEAGLFVTIGPPYGQEIAVAFAASVPLYDGLRPLVEPAAPYLEWMRDRVSAARASAPDFKGEWVYFFVTTAAE